MNQNLLFLSKVVVEFEPQIMSQATKPQNYDTWAGGSLILIWSSLYGINL